MTLREFYDAIYKAGGDPLWGEDGTHGESVFYSWPIWGFVGGYTPYLALSYGGEPQLYSRDTMWRGKPIDKKSFGMTVDAIKVAVLVNRLTKKRNFH